MKNKIFFSLLFCAFTFASSFAQDTVLVPSNKYKKVLPGMILGANRSGFWTGEAGFFLGLTNKSMEQTKIMSMFMHGPSLRCELSKRNDTLLIAPKFSYEYLTGFFSGRLSFVDYMWNGNNNLYFSPEVGMSFGSLINIFCGVNLPVSDDKFKDVKTFRLSITTNLLFFYFGKNKSGKK